MDSFAWKAAFDTGIADIDAQHRTLVDLLNQCEHTARHDPHGLSPATVARLKSHALDHFALEESCLAAANFEGIDLHRTQHRYFASRMAELEALPCHASPALASLTAFLRKWFLFHVTGADRDYVACLTKAERNPSAQARFGESSAGDVARRDDARAPRR
jgi:hemerythrin-like metal-binding protein